AGMPGRLVRLLERPGGRGVRGQLPEVASPGGPGAAPFLLPARLGCLLALIFAAILLPVARTDAQSVDERFTACLACHGADGQSRIPETPSLGGQPTFFVVAQLFLFREGRRDNPAMVASAQGPANSDRTAFPER